MAPGGVDRIVIEGSKDLTGAGFLLESSESGENPAYMLHGVIVPVTLAVTGDQVIEAVPSSGTVGSKTFACGRPYRSGVAHDSWILQDHWTIFDWFLVVQLNLCELSRDFFRFS